MDETKNIILKETPSTHLARENTMIRLETTNSTHANALLAKLIDQLERQGAASSFVSIIKISNVFLNLNHDQNIQGIVER